MTERAPDAWLITQPYTYPDPGSSAQDFCHAQDASWIPALSYEPAKVHNAEPLYTLPNALRAILTDRKLYLRVQEAFALGNVGNLVLKLENPEPPIPPEPEGDVIVTDRSGHKYARDPWNNQWLRDGDGCSHLGWSELWKNHGPLKVYRAE